MPPTSPPARCALTAPFHPYLRDESARRFAFCGAFPGVAPAGRYPAPCPYGARTFLSSNDEQRSPSRLVGGAYGRRSRGRHSSQFHSAVVERLAERVLALAPAEMQSRWARVFHVWRIGSDGDGDQARAAVLDRARREAAVPRDFAEAKLSRKYTRGAFGFGECAQARAVCADAAGVGTHSAVLLLPVPVRLRYPECNLECADALERLLAQGGFRRCGGVYFEPVVGATLGAVVPPPGYVARIAEICKRNGILLIADEVMTGMVRTGRPFAMEWEGVAPDMILVGKGIASGYAPLGAVIASVKWRA